MNNTRKITLGAMLLALISTFMLLDKYLLASGMSEIIFLLLALVLIMYGAKYSLKDSFILAACLAIIMLLFSTITTWLYYPISLISASIYVYGLKHKWYRRKLFISLVLVMIVGEISIVLLVQPLFGVSWQQFFTATQEQVLQLFSMLPLKANLSPLILKRFIWVIVIFSLFLTGFLEAILVHLLAIYLLQRFQIQEIRKIDIIAYKPTPLFAYLALTGCLPFFFLTYFKNNNILFIIVISLALLCAFYLLALAFIFLLIWGKIVYKRNFALFGFILLLFYNFIIIPYLIIGFLYGSGPLFDYLQKKRGQQ